MDTPSLLHQRLYTQHITNAPLPTPEAVVQWLGAMQAQDYTGAKWSVGLRLESATEAAVDAAYNAGRVLRTHVLRPTWHFVDPADIHWMLALTAPRIHALNGPYYRKFELDTATLAQCHAFITGALQGGNHLTREALADILAQKGIVAEKLRLSYIMMHAELEGLICSGAMQGKQHTYALLEEWVPPTATLSREEALATLARRFFLSHSPATVKDFAKWSSLSQADAKQGLEAVKSELVHDQWEGEAYWVNPTLPHVTEGSPNAYLIPEYDEAFIGYTADSSVDLPWTIDKATWHNFFYRPILIGGYRAGTWRRTLTKEGLVLDANLFATLDAVQWEKVEAAARHYGEFSGVEARVALYQ